MKIVVLFFIYVIAPLTLGALIGDILIRSILGGC